MAITTQIMCILRLNCERNGGASIIDPGLFGSILEHKRYFYVEAVSILMFKFYGFIEVFEKVLG